MHRKLMQMYLHAPTTSLRSNEPSYDREIIVYGDDQDRKVTAHQAKPLISHMAASSPGFAANTGFNHNESGQQANGPIQIGNNPYSKVINIGHSSEKEESYHCSLTTGCSSMVEGDLFVSKTKALVFQPYARAESKLVMPLDQVKLVKPHVVNGYKMIRIWMVDGGRCYTFLNFSNFDVALRRLFEAKPHPYLSFSFVKPMVEEDYCVQGYFSEFIAKEDLMNRPIGIQIKESYKCNHDSYLGQIKGTMYISSTMLEFCSDNPLFYYGSIEGNWTHQGSYYKLSIPLKHIKAYHGHGPPNRNGQENQLDFVPSWQYGCWQTPTITIHASPFYLPVSNDPRPDGGCNLCRDPGMYVFKFRAIQGFNKCFSGLMAVLKAAHKNCDLVR